jgi:hypothetical protein
MSVRYDLFPAFVTFVSADDPIEYTEMTSGPPTPKDARSYDKARVIVSGSNVLVAIDGDQGPRIVFNEELEPNSFIRSANRNQDSFLRTTSGRKLAFRRNDACGCGSRLRSWNPYRTLHSTKDPTE